MVVKLTSCSIHSICGQSVQSVVEQLITQCSTQAKTRDAFFGDFSQILWTQYLSPPQQVHYWLGDHRDSLKRHLKELEKSRARRHQRLRCPRNVECDADDESDHECEVIINKMMLLLSPNYPLNNPQETEGCARVLNWIAAKHRDWLAAESSDQVVQPPLQVPTKNFLEENDFSESDSDCDFIEDGEDGEDEPFHSIYHEKHGISHKPVETAIAPLEVRVESTSTQASPRKRVRTESGEDDVSFMSHCTTGEESNFANDTVPDENKRCKPTHASVSQNKIDRNIQLLHETSRAATAMNRMVNNIQALHQRMHNGSTSTNDSRRSAEMTKHMKDLHYLLVKMDESIIQPVNA
jgi:hypothetical protein